MAFHGNSVSGSDVMPTTSVPPLAPGGEVACAPAETVAKAIDAIAASAPAMRRWRVSAL